MTDNRKTSIALIAGSLGGIVTMAIHPTGASSHLAIVSPIAHSLALVSVLLLFLGAFQLTRILQTPDRLAFAALVTYAMAAVAVLIAASVSGFIMPNLLRMMSNDLPETAPSWRIVIASIFQINQAFSRIYSVATAAAITLWSASALRSGRLSRGTAVYGCITSPLIASLIFVGHLRLNIHGMAIVMLSEVLWFLGMASALAREDAQ